MRYKVSDIADIINVSIKNPSTSGIDVFVGLEHYDVGEPVITRYGSTEMLTTTVKGFQSGDILLARRNVYLRRAGKVDFDGVTSGDSIVIRVKEDLSHFDECDSSLMKSLLPFILNTNAFWDYANTNSDGTMSKRLSPQMLLDYEFDLPEKEEQRVLAEKLWAAYRLKESYKKLLAATQEMVKSQFIEMFGTLDEPKTEVRKMIDIAVSSGQYGSNTSATDYVAGSPRYIRITDINDDGSLNDDIKSAETYDEKYRVSINDILFARTGATVGKTYLHEKGNAIYAGYLIKYQMNEDVMRPRFMKAYTHSSTYYDWVSKTQKIGAQPNISAAQYDSMPVIVPSIEEQDAFLAIYNQADKSEFELRKSIESIDAVIKSLINS